MDVSRDISIMSNINTSIKTSGRISKIFLQLLAAINTTPASIYNGSTSAKSQQNYLLFMLAANLLCILQSDKLEAMNGIGLQFYIFAKTLLP
jgi:hypothetical protein